MPLAPWLVLLLASPADPDLAATVAGLETTEAMIRDLAVATDVVMLQKVALKVDKPVRMGFRTESIATSDGKFSEDAIGERVEGGPDGVKSLPGHWRVAFDGKVGRRIEGDVFGSFHSGSIVNRPTGFRGSPPTEYTTHFGREPISRSLRTRGPVFVGRDTWEGRPVVVIETAPTVQGTAEKFRFWIDPDRRIVVRRSRFLRSDPDRSPWLEYAWMESRDHKEVVPGIWLPMRFKYVSVDPSEDGKPAELRFSIEGTNSDWKVNQDPPTSTFRLEFPPGLRVNDFRR